VVYLNGHELWRDANMPTGHHYLSDAGQWSDRRKRGDNHIYNFR
jgi:hypothetical protein